MMISSSGSSGTTEVKTPSLQQVQAFQTQFKKHLHIRAQELSAGCFPNSALAEHKIRMARLLSVSPTVHLPWTYASPLPLLPPQTTSLLIAITTDNSLSDSNGQSTPRNSQVNSGL